MIAKASMESYAARLASFNAAHPSTKKRGSDARGAKTLKWPHKNPSPPQLARAGFFYQPTSSCPDNTTCYLCQSNLDGWEEGDDAVEEHLRLSPSCGWATTVAIEQDIENGSYSLEDPMSEKILEARRMTFGSKWPHENKRGWTCKVQKMIEAGWHYCPTLESDDFVKCSYCNLSLDGWEPKDKPFDEHQRRSPDCSFFTLYASIKSKPGRPKKTRASKASRQSTQSNFTAVSEGPSVVETDPNPDETVVSDLDSAKPTKLARGKKATKGKRATGKVRGKGTKTRQEESQIASSFIEPEDDNFEVKVDASPAPVTSNKKRKSDDINTVNENMSIVQTDEDIQSHAPTKKQRRTRASSSIVQSKDVNTMPPSPQAEVDAAMTDAESMPPPPGPISKKKGKGKGGKKTASSTTRKPSGASTASKASLRSNAPADEDIEAALEADLNRPLTDEEGDAEPTETEQNKGRRLTRNKSCTKKATASVAPTRRGTRASSVTPVEPLATNLYLSVSTVLTGSQEPDNESSKGGAHVDETAESTPETRIDEDKTTRDHPMEQDEQKDEDGGFQGTVSNADGDKVQSDSQTIKPRQIKGKLASRQLPARNRRASTVSAADDAIDVVADVNSSVLDTQTGQVDSGHETDASVAKQSRSKRGVKKVPAAVKKAKRGKKAAPKSQDVEVAPGQFGSAQTDEEDEETPNPTKAAEPHAAKSEPPKEPAEESTIRIGTTTNEHPVPTATEQPNAFLEAEDIPSLPCPLIHSTPRPALSSQSSDAENQPPSARPSSSRPPVSIESPSKSKTTKVPLAVTPISSPSKGSFSKLQSTFPWTAVDLETILHGTPSANKENDPFASGSADEKAEGALTSPEKKLTVEEWIHFNAQRGEERLRNECERLVGRFEGEGVRALRTLEGIICAP